VDEQSKVMPVACCGRTIKGHASGLLWTKNQRSCRWLVVDDEFTGN
jgi:hypothetical protein